MSTAGVPNRQRLLQMSGELIENLSFYLTNEDRCGMI